MSDDSFSRITKSPEETEALGAALARLVPNGSTVALTGDLGAGKTCFVRGMASTVAGELPVTSPTFTIVHEYRGDRAIYHLDLYRITDPSELADLGYEELFTPHDGICVVEWAERASSLLPERRVDIALQHISPTTRNIAIANRDCLQDKWSNNLADSLPRSR